MRPREGKQIAQRHIADKGRVCVTTVPALLSESLNRYLGLKRPLPLPENSQPTCDLKW